MTSETRNQPTFRALFESRAAEPPKTRLKPGKGIFSSGVFIWVALLLALWFGLLHLAGLREYTSVLNGTLGNVGVSWRTSVFLGAMYILSYLGCVVVAPILMLAGLLLKLVERWRASQSVEPGASPSKE